MRAYRFKGEKTLTELVRKVYDIRRKGLTAADVGSALAKANPSLKLASKSLGKKIQPETLIFAPTSKGPTTHQRLCRCGTPSSTRFQARG